MKHLKGIIRKRILNKIHNSEGHYVENTIMQEHELESSGLYTSFKIRSGITDRSSVYINHANIVYWRKMKMLLRRFRYIILSSVLAVFVVLSYYLNAHLIVLQYLGNVFVDITAQSGLVLQEVKVEGRYYAKESEINEAIAANIGDPLFGIDIVAIKARLESISWVKHATIERSVPGTLYVKIIERQPLALWQEKGALHLVDAEGKVIKELNLTQFADLLIIVGDDAPAVIQDVLNIIKQDPDLFKHIEAVTRVGSRRWNIHLDNKIEIKLPEESPEDAWKYIINMHKEKMLLNQNLHIIDLRIKNKLYIR
jgi:cell division protein FtsQ